MSFATLCLIFDLFNDVKKDWMDWEKAVDLQKKLIMNLVK